MFIKFLVSSKYSRILLVFLLIVLGACSSEKETSNKDSQSNDTPTMNVAVPIDGRQLTLVNRQLLDRYPEGCRDSDATCSRAAEGQQFLVVWFTAEEPAEDSSGLDTLMAFTEASQPSWVIAADGTRSEVRGSGLENGRYFALYTVAASASEFNLFLQLAIPSGRVVGVNLQDGQLVNEDGTIAEPLSDCDLYTAHVSPLEDTALRPDGEMLASASETEVLLWSVQDRTVIGRLTLPESPFVQKIDRLAWSDDGRTLVTSLQSNRVFVWRWPEGETNTTPELLHTLGCTSGSCSLTFSPDGRWLVDNSTVEVWSLDTGQRVAYLSPGEDYRGYGARPVFSPDGEWLYAYGSSHREGDGYNRVSGIGVYSTADWQLQTVIQTGNPFVLSADGTRIAAVGQEGVIEVWSAPDGETITRIEGAHETVTELALSPDGQWLASIGLPQDNNAVDGVVKLWSVADGTLQASLEGHTDNIRTITFSPDGQLVVSKGADSTIRFWSLPGGELLSTIPTDTPFGASVKGITPNNEVAILSYSGQIRAVSLPDGEVLGCFVSIE